MALLDRFRAQPRQKHPDTAVRLTFVQEIPIAERDLLAEIARDDPDSGVRRAAVGKLMDPAALAGVAAADTDEDVRSAALVMLRDIALDAFEDVTEADSVAAVDALTETKTLGGIAKMSERTAVARRALDRINDAHALGSIARHARLESIRGGAFAALHDPAEILAVALNSEFKDTAVPAVEQLVNRSDVEQVASRAKSKSAVKRARALLREIDERAAAEAAASAPVQPETLTPVAPDPPPVDGARIAAEQAQAAERARFEAEAMAHLRDQERALDGTRAQEANERRAAQRAERQRARLAELAQEADAAALEDLASARQKLKTIRREWSTLIASGAAEPDVAKQYADAESRYAAREQEAREQEERGRRDALVRLHQLLSRVESLAARPDLSLKAGDRALKDVRTALADMPSLPTKQDYDAVVERLKAAQATLTPKMQELRDIAEWQRWANVGIQEQLCAKMEALDAIEDAEEIARQIRELQQQWQQAVDVPRAQSEALWRRFKAAHDRVWPRCEAHFAVQAQVRAENLARKVALSERAEALSESKNWIQTADEIKRLQADWKTIGPVSRGQEKAVWERFRLACDRFFSRRHADLADRKKLWAENLAKKEALCVRAEGLAESVDWDPTAAEIRQLQIDWKSIGAVKKNRSEAIWQRFHTACDRFFARYARRHEVARAERVAACEGMCAELESLAPADAPDSGGDPPADLLAKLRTLRSGWQQQLASRGVDRDRALSLDARFQAGFARVVSRWPSVVAGTDLDTESNRKRMETLVRRVEDLASPLVRGADPAVSPTTALAAMLKEALAANTIGGRADEDSRLRAAAEEVYQAQSSWSRIGPVPDDVRRVLTDRFTRACRAITSKVAQTGKPGSAGMAGAAARGGRR